MPWRLQVRTAKARGARIEAAVDEQSAAFQERQSRVVKATERAERAAVTLMKRSDDLARAVARRK